MLPGIVDLHGDAFERQLQPRPGIGFPVSLALEDTERQLLANGITTAYHGLTLSWEPGLRGLEAWQALLTALAARTWTCDMRVHLRWEAYNLDALEIALADIAAGRVHLLAFNDHTPSIMRKLGDPTTTSKYARTRRRQTWRNSAPSPNASPPAKAKSPPRSTASPPPPAPPACQWRATTTTASPRATRSAIAVRASANSPWRRRSAAPPAPPATP